MVLWLLYDVLSLKNYVNVPSKCNTGKQKKILDPDSQKHGSADPDPYQNVTEPQYWGQFITDPAGSRYYLDIFMDISLNLW